MTATNCTVCMGTGKAPVAWNEYVACECTKTPSLVVQMQQAREADAQQLHTITLAVKRMRQMKAALQACEAYFEERADAEYFPDSASPCGNEEMRLLVEVREAIAGLSREVSA